VCAGVVILRRTAPHNRRPFRTPGVPWVPALGAIICLAQMVGLPGETWVRLLIWLAIGLVIYFTYGHAHAHAARLASDDPTIDLHLSGNLSEHSANR
jgi:basic amino acid/polyamine antiporter, APA family